MSALAGFIVYLEEHNLEVIEVDGVYTKPSTIGSVYISSGQRYGILVTTHPSSERNYGLLAAMGVAGFKPLAIPSDMRPNVTATFVYNGIVISPFVR